MSGLGHVWGPAGGSDCLPTTFALLSTSVLASERVFQLHTVIGTEILVAYLVRGGYSGCGYTEMILSGVKHARIPPTVLRSELLWCFNIGR